jgi:hypothetical protein
MLLKDLFQLKTLSILSVSPARQQYEQSSSPFILSAAVLVQGAQQLVGSSSGAVCSSIDSGVPQRPPMQPIKCP